VGSVLLSTYPQPPESQKGKVVWPIHNKTPLNSQANCLKSLTHSGNPAPDLINYQNMLENVELVLPPKLAQMVVEAGLTSWLLKKIK